MTAEELAKILHQELDAEGWGDISMDVIYYVANPVAAKADGVSEDVELARDVTSLRAVLTAVCDRLPR